MSERVRYISRLEQVLIIGFAGILVLFVYGQFISDIISHYNWNIKHDQELLAQQATGTPIISFGPPGYFVAGFHLISMFVFLVLIVGRKFYAALVLTLAYLAILLYAHYSRFRDLESALNGWDADAINLVVFILLLLLLIWELAIVFRVVRQTLKTSKLA
jgi:hypothetical protein